MNRSEILEEAKKQVCGQREHDYGNPENSFLSISKLWSAYLNFNITPKDVACMMSLLKIARIKSGVKIDSSVDLAGYAACIGEMDSKFEEEFAELR